MVIIHIYIIILSITKESEITVCVYGNNSYIHYNSKYNQVDQGKGVYVYCNNSYIHYNSTYNQVDQGKGVYIVIIHIYIIILSIARQTKIKVCMYTIMIYVSQCCGWSTVLRQMCLWTNYSALVQSRKWSAFEAMLMRLPTKRSLLDEKSMVLMSRVIYQ